MGVKYRAVHLKNSWRRVNHHNSLETAIDGRDGAKALLLKKGRIAGMWEKYGPPLGVFIWEDGHVDGYLFRLNPDNNSETQSVKVPVHAIMVFEKGAVCGEAGISYYFK